MFLFSPINTLSVKGYLTIAWIWTQDISSEFQLNNNLHEHPHDLHFEM